MCVENGTERGRALAGGPAERKRGERRQCLGSAVVAAGVMGNGRTFEGLRGIRSRTWFFTWFWCDGVKGTLQGCRGVPWEEERGGS